MTVSRNTVVKAIEIAKSEVAEFGLPTELHLDLSIQKAQEIARRLQADVNLVTVGAALMDLKLGQAFSEKRLAAHVDMSVSATKDFLRREGVDGDEAEVITNSVAAHHGAIPFGSLEAEIVANADCYRFIHPRGVIHYIGTLTKRGLSLEEICKQVEAKLDEKWGILSLSECKKELEHHYRSFKDMLAAARNP